jgi:hypothetical protein
MKQWTAPDAEVLWTEYPPSADQRGHNGGGQALSGDERQTRVQARRDQDAGGDPRLKATRTSSARLASIPIWHRRERQDCRSRCCVVNQRDRAQRRHALDRLLRWPKMQRCAHAPYCLEHQHAPRGATRSCRHRRRRCARVSSSTRCRVCGAGLVDAAPGRQGRWSTSCSHRPRGCPPGEQGRWSASCSHRGS